MTLTSWQQNNRIRKTKILKLLLNEVPEILNSKNQKYIFFTMEVPKILNYVGSRRTKYLKDKDHKPDFLDKRRKTNF